MSDIKLSGILFILPGDVSDLKEENVKKEPTIADPPYDEGGIVGAMAASSALRVKL